MNRDTSFSGRGRLFSSIIVIVLGMLLLRVAKLQIVDTTAYSGESRSNAVREQRVLPARGVVLDRNGTLLVDNEPTYTILFTPRYFDEERLPLLADILEVPDSLVEARLARAKRWNAFRPSAAFRAVPIDRISRLVEHRDRLPGVTYEVAQKRRYVTDVRASHVFGYVREINDRDLDRRSEDGYRQGDLFGQSGIERTYERELRGTVGSSFKLVNVHGQEVDAFRGGEEDRSPRAGFDMTLTLDAELQALAESLFVGKRGGLVAMDPNDGGILAMVSKPDFDPDLFSRPVSPELWTYLNESPEKPLFNRATMSVLSPGSTWKPIMALIALESGAVTPEERITCAGYHPYGRGRAYRCMHVHGSISVGTALRESCNTYFFEMMRRVDVNTMADYSRRLGFGVRSALDIPQQVAGLVPDSSYYNRVVPGGWTVGYAMNLGVGQGELSVTPLQLARYAAAVGNGREVPVPHVVERLVHPETGEVQSIERPDPTPLPFQAEYVDIVREAMRATMDSGTGKWIQITDIPSGGKTGTAQNPRGKDDSVFILFAPFDNPQIAVAALVENAGYGATAAGPIATLLAEQYLTGSISPRRKWQMDSVLALESDPLPQPNAE